MALEDLTTGRRTSIFASRGRGAKGWQLDEYAMLQTVSEIELALKNSPDAEQIWQGGRGRRGHA